MKREINFRVWDKENKAFMPSEGYAICDGDVMGLRYGNEMEDVLTDQIELMQNTGLKDVNGKDIYENDILKVTSDDGAFYVATVKWFGDDGYPAFDLEGIPAAWCYDSNALATIFKSSIETCEVIGNIYENPELLEV